MGVGPPGPIREVVIYGLEEDTQRELIEQF